jgi:gas vesicle protein
MKRLIMGVAIGAGAMYLLDPERGAERRSKLFGFYGENKDTFQDYAQTAAQTAATVSHTVSDVASTVADKAGEITGKSSPDDAGVGDETASGNGRGTPSSGSATISGRIPTRKSSAAPATDEPAPGTGGSRSS